MVRLASGRKLSTSSQPYAGPPGFRAAARLVSPSRPPTRPTQMQRERRSCNTLARTLPERATSRHSGHDGEICIIWLPDWPTSVSPIGAPPMRSVQAIGMRKGPPVKIFSIAARERMPFGSTSLRADIVAVGEPVCTRVLRYRRT